MSDASEKRETLGKEICRELPHIDITSAAAFCARGKTRALPTNLIDITHRGSSDCVGSRGGRG